jgi:hypothetical protein
MGFPEHKGNFEMQIRIEQGQAARPSPMDEFGNCVLQYRSVKVIGVDDL